MTEPDRPRDEPDRLGDLKDPSGLTSRTGGPSHDAIVLAGGSGSRLGGVDKAALVVAGRPLLDRVLGAAAAARAVVVVGPVEVPDGIRQVVEDPPGGGPVAGIAAGFAALEPPPGAARPGWTLVLAVDQPAAVAAVPAVLAAAASADPATGLVCHRDTGGHPQWLLAAYRTAALARALGPVGTGHGVSVRRLVADLTILDVTEGSGHVGDVDTWEDHRAWQERLSSGDGTLGPQAR